MSKFYSSEEIKKANEYNLVEILKKCGYDLVPQGNQYYLKEHDSLKVSEYKGWHWFSKGIGGKNTDFFIQYENLSFTDAVKRIYSVVNDELDIKSKKMAENEDKWQNTLQTGHDLDIATESLFILPEKSATSKRVYAYLSITRKIDEELVKKMINEGYIYESVKNHNVVFIGKNFRNEAVSAFERGTTKKRFVRETKGSDKRYRFRLENENSEIVNVFESEIDLLSYITLHDLDIKDNYISLGGVSSLALAEFLNHRKNIKIINLCLDNDIAGEKANRAIKEKFRDKYQIKITKPINKDFNEDLTKDGGLKNGNSYRNSQSEGWSR